MKMLDFLDQNKEWIFSGIGISLLGFLAFSSRVLYLRYVTYRRIIYEYVGCYEVYKFKPKDNGDVAQIAAQIHWSWTGRLKVRVRSHRYKLDGRVKVFFHNVYFLLQGSRGVRGIWIVHEPLNQFDYLVGINCDISLSGYPTSSKILLKKVAASDVDAIQTTDIPARDVDPTIAKLLEVQSTRRINVPTPSVLFLNDLTTPESHEHSTDNLASTYTKGK